MSTVTMIRQIQEEYERETGERPSYDAACVILDRMCDAFVHLSEGVGLEEAVRRYPEVAQYLAWRWLGDEGRALRKAIAAAT